MRNCPNCGGGLKYDIAKGQLSCGNCSSLFPVGSISETNTAKQNDSFEVTIFTCPQCGGEISSTSDTAMGFCSFCGASVQLEGRLAKQAVPKTIVPFKVTKQKCSEAFRKHAGKYPFSPKELKAGGGKQEYRGIYMPFWDYTVHQNANVRRQYIDEHRRGDYRIVKHYDFEWDLDEDIKNIQHDASSSFEDDIGIAISPFDPKDAVEFDSGYMEGFYADVADVKAEDYARFALDNAVGQTERAISTKTMGVRSDNGPRGNEEFGGMITEKNLAFFPVWFLSSRTGNRISYSVVNGQTGKVYMDLPVSLGKFFGVTAAMTVILTLIFSLFFTPTPQADVGIAMILSIAASVLFTVLSGKILVRDGLLEGKNENKNFTDSTKSGSFGRMFNMVGIFILLIALYMAVSIASMVLKDFFNIPLLPLLAMLASVVAMMKYLTRRQLFIKANGKGLFLAPVAALIAAVLGFVVLVLNPPSDILYYGITIASMTVSAISLVSVITLRNLLSTRRLPEFDTHKGGDHRGR